MILERGFVHVLFAGRSIEFLFASSLVSKKITAEFVFETAGGSRSGDGANSNGAAPADVCRTLWK